jgi:hydrogenase expression/formation protein HypD
MKFLDEYRDPVAARKLVELIHRATTRPWTIMEICGGQTHTIVKYGLDGLLPPDITLVHGPGCPVCVTPAEMVDQAVTIALRPDVIFCSFGDMLRVPGTRAVDPCLPSGPSGGAGGSKVFPVTDLLSAKAAGGDVRIVYSPLDAVRLATQHPDRTVVFFAVGFETTAPANAQAVWQARRLGLNNFALLVSQVLVPPAMTAILSSPNNRVQGFLAAGHVCTVMGYADYEPLAERFQTPIVVTGFEPVDLLEGIYRCVRRLEAGAAGVENQYVRVVRREGNPSARRLIAEVFEVTDRAWRGLGIIPASGYRLRPAFAEFDAERRFPPVPSAGETNTPCLSGLILQGLKKPHECPAFGSACTPEHPLGATMVSSEGACAAYYHYGRRPPVASAPPVP